MEYLLRTNGLTKRYGHKNAVDHVNLHIRQGAIYGLIGRNGAGKTTILRMIAGLASPTEGEISLFGETGKKALYMTSRIGTLIEAPGLYPNMSAAENLKLKCLALGVRKKGYIDELLDAVGLSGVGRKRVRNFSLGMKQRVGLAMALMEAPELLVLDEPTNALDEKGQDMLAQAKYEVGDATEGENDGFVVEVSAEPFTAFDGLQDEVMSAVQAEMANITDISQLPSDEEINEMVFQKMYDILVQRVAEPTYGEAQTVEIHVELNDNVYSINQDDLTTLDGILFPADNL